MIRTLALAFALLLSIPALAQTHADAMTRLAPYQGSYTITGDAQIEDGSYAGTLTVSPTLGGHFQEWTWVMNSDGMPPTHLRFLTTYDTSTHTYVIWRFDSRDLTNGYGQGGNDTEGSLQFDGDALVMAWPTTNPEDPSMHGLFRNTIRITSNGLNVSTDVKLDGDQALVAIATTQATRR